MITSEKIHPVLDAHDVDVVVASTPTHVFYTSGVITSTTVTPHAENFEETGYYYDTPESPPKNLSIWSRDHDRPFLVLAPNETGQLPELDVEETYVYVPDRFDASTTDEPATEPEPAVVEALENSYDSIYAALTAALDGLVDASSTVALERMSLSPTVRDHVEARIDDAAVTEATELFHELRLTKTDEEIERLKAAAEANEAAIMDSLDELEEGMTEQEFANVFRVKQTEHGATHRHTHIGFGPNSAHGHVVPGDRVIQEGDLVRFEVGCYFVDDRGFDRRIDPRHTLYPGDLARTFAFKSAPESARRQYEVIHAAMKHCESLMADGVEVAEVHTRTMAHAREVARDVGATKLEDWTSHMIGHNVGLDCHDHPLLTSMAGDREHDTLEAGMVMNWELAHLEHGVGGLQLEETGAITPDGVERFTTAPESLRVID